MTNSNNSSTNTTSKKMSNNNNNNNNSLLVAILDPTVAAAADEVQDNRTKTSTYLSVRLPCLKSGIERDYLHVSCGGASQQYLLEIQCLEAPPNPANKTYASWFVGNHVVANGNLYTMTRVDPLFFVLAKFSQEVALANNTNTEQQKLKQQWQPLEQMLLAGGEGVAVPAVIQACLDPQQLRHICDSYEMDEDECFYKFSPTKSLKWLQKKQQCVYHVLLQHLQDQQQQAERQRKLGQRGGAFAAGFNLTSSSENSSADAATEKENNNKSSTTSGGGPTTEQIQQAKHESIQVVCNYLGPEWQRAFLNHLNVAKETVLLSSQEEQQLKKKVKETSGNNTTPGASAKTASAADNNTDPSSFFAYTAAAVTPAAEQDSKNKPPPSVTFGQKQLAKVNKKGMKSMMSFFVVKKKS